MTKKPDEKFSPEETQKRFEAALRGARVAGHKPKDEVSAKGKADRAATKPTKAKKPSK